MKHAYSTFTYATMNFQIIMTQLDNLHWACRIYTILQNQQIMSTKIKYKKNPHFMDTLEKQQSPPLKRN